MQNNHINPELAETKNKCINKCFIAFGPMTENYAQKSDLQISLIKLFINSTFTWPVCSLQSSKVVNDFWRRTPAADLVECDLKIVVSTPEAANKVSVHLDNVLEVTAEWGLT